MWTEVTLQDKVLTYNRYLMLFLLFKTSGIFFFSFFTCSCLSLSNWDFWNVIVSIFRLWFSCLINKDLLYFLSLLSARWVRLTYSWCSHRASNLNLPLLTFWTWPWDGPEMECVYLDKLVISSFFVVLVLLRAFIYKLDNFSYIPNFFFF